MLKNILSRLLLSMIMFFMAGNGQVLAEIHELETYAHLIKIESQHTAKTSVYDEHEEEDYHLVHTTKHSQPQPHSHKHRHSSDEPEHEHFHSDGAIFGNSSVFQFSESTHFLERFNSPSKELTYSVSYMLLPEGHFSSNFRPPIL